MAVRHRLSATHQKTLGDNIRVRRQRLGLTQQQLAETVAVEPRVLQAIEYGTHGVSLALFLSLAAVLKVSPMQLLKGVVPPKRS